jgi:hypothetical protein
MMKAIGVLIVVLLLGYCLLQAEVPLRRIDGLLPTYADEMGYCPDCPPPIDSIYLVFSGVDYENPQIYPNAKHVTNVMVGSYYFPVIIWETGNSWGGQSLFTYWEDMFKFWAYPDSFTNADGQDTGRPAVCSDSHGNLHFIWHQGGNPDGYEIYYTQAVPDTSYGFVQYSVDRSPERLSDTNGEEEVFPVIAIQDDNLCVVWRMGSDDPIAIMYNYSHDGGTTWAGADTAFFDTMPGSWILPSIAPDPVDGDMWVSINFDYTGDGSMDVVALFYDVSGDTWSHELAADAPSMHAYCIPVIAVDNSGVPHIVFQENIGCAGGLQGLAGWLQTGPGGTLYYIHRHGGSWSAPRKILFPDTMLSFATGWPSIGITSNDTVYFSTTLPESVTPDTSVFLPFNAHYAALVPYTGDLLYGGSVSNLPEGDSTCASYPHITYEVPLPGEIPVPCDPGPGITWAQRIDEQVPVDLFYCHKDLIPSAGVEEHAFKSRPSPALMVCPNPFHGRIEISIAGVSEYGSIGVSELQVYDVSGRRVREISLLPFSFSLGGKAEWDGRDNAGEQVSPGIYFVHLRIADKVLTKKIIMVQ